MGSEAKTSQADVQTAWEAAPEQLRREVTLGVLRANPGLFKDWMTGARLVAGGNRPEKVARREQSSHRSRLDQALWLDADGADPTSTLAGRVMLAYFTQHHRTLNDAFMKGVEDRKLDEQHSDPKTASAIVAQLRELEVEMPARHDLYAAAVRWLNPGWFRTAG